MAEQSTPPFEDEEEDDFAELFLANLNENTREKTPEEEAEYEREKYPNVP